jgi:hypothetical protein
MRSRRDRDLDGPNDWIHRRGKMHFPDFWWARSVLWPGPPLPARVVHFPMLSHGLRPTARAWAPDGRVFRSDSRPLIAFASH